jgi:hypothetical protein
MLPQITDGPAINTIESTTNKVLVNTLDFDAATAEYAQFEVRMPKSWNQGAVQFAPVWSHSNTAANFDAVWVFSGVARSNTTTIDTSWGATSSVTTTGGSNNAILIGGKTSNTTIGGTVGQEAVVMFRVARDASSVSDTMTIDARLHGVTVYYTSNTVTDS